MRWYKIVVDGQPLFDATGDPNALDVEIDISVSKNLQPADAASFVRIWGIPLSMLQNANSKFMDKTIEVWGGMQKGLPLANPSQAGMLVTGKINPALGNWVGIDMTLDFYVKAGAGQSNVPRAANLIHDWPANTPLKQALQKAFNTAYPTMKQIINISDKLKLPYADTGFYQTFRQYHEYIYSISKAIIKDANYLGIQMMMHGDTVHVDDGTQTATSGPKIDPWDLVGQPIWTGVKSCQFKTVMRADILPAMTVTIPTTFANFGDASNQQGVADASNTIGGSWRIMNVHHVGKFRNPDWQSWVTVFNAQKGS